MSASSAAAPRAPARPLPRPAPGIIAALFCGYLAVGLPLPVLPLFLHDGLGFGSLTVGLVIGLQFLATVLTRGHAGSVTGHRGGRRAAHAPTVRDYEQRLDVSEVRILIAMASIFLRRNAHP